MSAAGIKSIVVHTTPQEKKAIIAKARCRGLSMSDLMRRGVVAYSSAEAEKELVILTDAVRVAADRASESIDDVLAFCEASNKRIVAMVTKAHKARKVAEWQARPKVNL